MNRFNVEALLRGMPWVDLVVLVGVTGALLEGDREIFGLAFVAWLFFAYRVLVRIRAILRGDYPPPPAQGRKSIPARIRCAVFARDGYRCRRCGSHHHLQIDHITPHSWGGSDDPSNLQTLCCSCTYARALGTLGSPGPFTSSLEFT
jgi:5-methylcytosine-specific restriction enzyme A